MNSVMEIELHTEPITGRERCQLCGSAYNALVQFYRAFNERDMELMQANWNNGDDIAMDNPLGGIKRGWDEISQVYDKLFSGPASVYVEFYEYSLHETSEMFYAVGRERGYLEHSAEVVELAIRTSRIFRRINGNWRQVHHHGSIENPRMLERYQRAVLAR